jgi:ribosomal protein S7
MPRRRRPETREIIADPVYNSTLAEKFVNSMMWDGKKAVSQRIFYDAMNKIKERRELQASARSKDSACGRRQLSGPSRSPE